MHAIMCCTSTLKKLISPIQSIQCRISLPIRIESHGEDPSQDPGRSPIEAKTSASDVADEEQFFFTQADGEDETEEQTLVRKEQSRKKATDWVAHEEPSSMKPSMKEFTKIHVNTMSYSIHGIQANARTRVEQNVNLVLKNLKLKTFLASHMTKCY